LYSAIFTVSSFLLQSVTTEKENRLVEILITSVPPFELLLGKVLGLGTLGLVQVGVWTAMGGALFQTGVLAALGGVGLQSGIGGVVAGVVFFALGYFFYASLMAAIGAVAPSLKESGPITLVLLLPAWTPFLLLRPLLSDPNGALARGLTFFPPTTALVALIRLMSGYLATWEAIAAAVVLAAAGIALLLLAGRLFRAAILLSGSTPSAGQLAAALLAREV
jgi:ABC-2 type transport system permease protein